MRILYITTLAITVNSFLIPHIRTLIKNGNNVDIACHLERPINKEIIELGCKIIEIHFSRSPISISNISACMKLRKIVFDGEYDIVHCHTPVAAACTRLACIGLRKNEIKVFYTAHGFHFFNGAPLVNWLIYFPIEWMCSFWTDLLITINKEDYNCAKTMLHAKNVEYIRGVGIDLHKFGIHKADRELLRESLGIPLDATVFLSVNELPSNYNYDVVINAFSKVDAYYLIVGKEGGELSEIVDKVGISDRVKKLGYRNDIGDLMSVSDFFVVPSFQDSLTVRILEAMASGLICIVGNTHTNIELIDKKCGFVFNHDSILDCRKALMQVLALDFSEKKLLVRNSLKKVNNFNISIISEEISELPEDCYQLADLIIRNDKRVELGIPADAKLALNVGELIPRKNQELILRVAKEIKDLFVIIAGEGVEKDRLNSLISSFGLNDRVKLLGYRTDILELNIAADFFLFPSLHEGLPVALMEAMARGLPIVCSKIRGNTDLVDTNNGFLFESNSVEDCKKAINAMFEADIEKLGYESIKKVKSYGIDSIDPQMMNLYYKYGEK